MIADFFTETLQGIFKEFQYMIVSNASQYPKDHQDPRIVPANKSMTFKSSPGTGAVAQGVIKRKVLSYPKTK